MAFINAVLSHCQFVWLVQVYVSYMICTFHVGGIAFLPLVSVSSNWHLKSQKIIHLVCLCNVVIIVETLEDRGLYPFVAAM